MEILQVTLTALISAVVLFLLTKLMGEKQISQMSMFDYVVGITIGSIGAEMATELEKSMLSGIAALTVYALLSIGISFASRKSLRLRRFLSGRPVLLYYNGILYRQHFQKMHMDIGEFLSLSRAAGYFDLNDIHVAILEKNGSVSFLPKAAARPATPADLGQTPPETQLLTNVILDGHVVLENLKSAGRDANWLTTQLTGQGYRSEKEILLACIDSEGCLRVYPFDVAKKPPMRFE